MKCYIITKCNKSDKKPVTRQIIKNATMVNEGTIREVDLAIKGRRIHEIASSIDASAKDTIHDAQGMWLLPGMIDDQVHFREPGLTHKGNIASESKAAVSGGITSYMEMPNVTPATTDIQALRHKHQIAAQHSLANYSFYLGATPDNLEQIKQVDPTWVCGVKVFMGASTGDLLVEHPQQLEAIFRECPTLIATHCENGAVIAANLKRLQQEGQILTPELHPVIRDTEACYQSSSYAVALAKKFGSDLHVLHLTTAKELELFTAGPITDKKITAEACIHHLWFNQDDYPRLGNLIKCNPAIKAESDRQALLQAIKEQRIDIIATDHAPHTWSEKQQDYPNSPAGLPLVQHALLSLLEHVHQGTFSIEQIVEKIAHNPALRFHIKDRGFIREGYFADLVLVDPTNPTQVTHGNNLYACGWSPFDGVRFKHSIHATYVNGHKAFCQTQACTYNTALPLTFER